MRIRWAGVVSLALLAAGLGLLWRYSGGNAGLPPQTAQRMLPTPTAEAAEEEAAKGDKQDEGNDPPTEQPAAPTEIPTVAPLEPTVAAEMPSTDAPTEAPQEPTATVEMPSTEPPTEVPQEPTATSTLVPTLAATPTTAVPPPVAKPKLIRTKAPKQAPAPRVRSTPVPSVPSAHAVDRAHEWRHFGAAPFAATRAEAMQKRESVFRAMYVPEHVIAEFMRLTERMGESARITNGDHLDVMAAKNRIERNVTVAFDKPPVSDRMEYAAPAEMWQVEWQGKTYVLYLPRICNNWSLVVKAECVQLAFHAKLKGHVRWGVGSLTGPLPRSSCNWQRQGDGPEKGWYGRCDDCVPLDTIQKTLGPDATIPYGFEYEVIAKEQVISFSTDIWADVVYVCLEDEDGNQTCGMYTRPVDWNHRNYVEIPDDAWVWSEVDCPQ